MPYRHNLPSPSTLIGAHSDSGPTHTDVAHQGIFTPDHLEDRTCFKETLASISVKQKHQSDTFAPFTTNGTTALFTHPFYFSVLYSLFPTFSFSGRISYVCAQRPAYGP